MCNHSMTDIENIFFAIGTEEPIDHRRNFRYFDCVAPCSSKDAQ